MAIFEVHCLSESLQCSAIAKMILQLQETAK
jgi:hypothetical protein